MAALYFCAVLVLLPYRGCAFEMEENQDTTLHEGDIRLNPRQKYALEFYGDPTVSLGGTRALASDPTMLWLHHIPYVITPEMSTIPEALAAITEGIDEWQERSCLKFVKRTTEKDYLRIFKGSGCWSYVGRQGGLQNISLASGCWHRGTVAHEIGHAMGFWHEQSRPDRDSYVTIVWDNVPKAKQHNFLKYSRQQVDSLGVPYDYLSVMHYSMTAFSSNGNATIVPVDSSVGQLGQRVGFSPFDEKQANLLYKCNGVKTKPLAYRPPELCTFDTPGDLCGFQNDQSGSDQFDWTQRLGKTPSGSTGPWADHTTGRWGWFMYMEASHPRVANDTAVLRSAVYPASGTRCLHFYYHMYGKSMGNLRVTYRLIGSSSDNEVWTKKGDQGNSWKLAKVNLPPSKSGLQIAFVGRRGSSYTGDAAIDDVFFTDGPC